MNTTQFDSPVILLVEDDDNDAFAMELVFKKARLPTQVRRVTDGQQAIDYLAGEAEYADRLKFPLPSLLLIDWHMPLKNGAEVLRWVRAQKRFANLVTVVLSGSQREADMKHAYAMGANSYLVKPNDFTNFLRTVELCDGYWRLNHVPNSRPKSKIANSAELE